MNTTQAPPTGTGTFQSGSGAPRTGEDTSLFQTIPEVIDGVPTGRNITVPKNASYTDQYGNKQYYTDASGNPIPSALSPADVIDMANAGGVTPEETTQALKDSGYVLIGGIWVWQNPTQQAATGGWSSLTPAQQEAEERAATRARQASKKKKKGERVSGNYGQTSVTTSMGTG